MASGQRTSGEEDEQRLIEGLQRNDRDSLAAIYDAYSGIAYGLAVQVMGGGAEAEDVVQESFLALWRQAPRLDPARGVRSYLLTIVHNKAVDRIRRRGRRPEVNLDPDIALPSSDKDDPESVAQGLAEREEVRTALSLLPEEQRRTIELTYYKGMTINEAAALMGVPVGTAKSRLRLGFGHLRRRLLERQ
jgi:RNA polymerase sigma-70 factor (ECF subfamily)